MEYKSIYKCRLCGEVFSDGETDKSNARFVCTGLMMSEHLPNRYTGFSSFRNIVHFCKDGSFGFADFQGFEKMNEE